MQLNGFPVKLSMVPIQSHYKSCHSWHSSNFLKVLPTVNHIIFLQCMLWMLVVIVINVEVSEFDKGSCPQITGKYHWASVSPACGWLHFWGYNNFCCTNLSLESITFYFSQILPLHKMCKMLTGLALVHFYWWVPRMCVSTGIELVSLCYQV